MRPVASSLVYEIRDIEENPTGARFHNQFEIREDGSVIVSTFRELDGGISAGSWTKTVRLGFFVELPPNTERGIRWSYEYDATAMDRLSHLEPGVIVEIPATSIMDFQGQRNHVQDVHRVTHEGCSDVEIIGDQVQVHRLRFDTFNQFVNRNGEPETRQDTVFREYSTAYGWWVAERHPTLGPVILVGAENPPD
jgi:hypothetical protein